MPMPMPIPGLQETRVWTGFLHGQDTQSACMLYKSPVSFQGFLKKTTASNTASELAEVRTYRELP